MNTQDDSSNTATLYLPRRTATKSRFIGLMRRDAVARSAPAIRRSVGEAQGTRAQAPPPIDESVLGTRLGHKTRTLLDEIRQLELALGLPRVSAHSGPRAERLVRGALA